jgi:hypothetical protein
MIISKIKKGKVPVLKKNGEGTKVKVFLIYYLESILNLC